MLRPKILGILAIVLCSTLPVTAQTLWRENAENGLADILDGTSSGYSLIQSDFVSEGSNAFHLANPGFEDNWFVLDQDISIQADTKLFFQSRLSWATSGQVAKVQLSSDGGSSWGTNLYSQAGTGDGGEGAFGLREIDLSPYASQNARFRFLYDHTGGSAYTQSDTHIGWRIDDIQIGAELAKTEYSIGNPSPDAQLYLEYLNRARSDAMVEAHRLASETDSDITSAYNFFGIDAQDIVDQFQWYVDNGCLDQYAQPLAFSASLNQMAELHTQDMFDNAFQGHTSSSDPPAPFPPNATLGERIDAVGYQGAAGENVFSYADSAQHGHAGFNVDWGNLNLSSRPCYNPAFIGQGMQNPAGHRTNIHNGDFKEAGIGVVNGTNGGVGPQLVTQNLGDPGAATFVTGVVYEDLDGDNFYDIGEGRSGVRVDVDGSGFFAVSTDSGAYAVPVSGDGTYEVNFSGGGFNDFLTTANVAGGDNVKIDYLASAAAFDPADFNGDGFVDGLDLAQWRDDFGVNTESDADSDNDSDGADLLAWQRALTVSSTIRAVPEPTAGVLLSLGGSLGLAARRRRG